MSELTFGNLGEFLLDLKQQLERIEKKLNEKKGNPNTFEQETPMSIKEAATFLNLKESTIYNLVSANEIPFHKPGKRLCFYPSELNDFIRQDKKGGSK